MSSIRFTLSAYATDKAPARGTMAVNPLALLGALARALQRLLQPTRSVAKVGIGAARDLTRTRSELLAENTS